MSSTGFARSTYLDSLHMEDRVPCVVITCLMSRNNTALHLFTVPQVSRLYHNYSGPLLVPMTLRSLLRMVIQDAGLKERAGLSSEDVKQVRLSPPVFPAPNTSASKQAMERRIPPKLHTYDYPKQASTTVTVTRATV